MKERSDFFSISIFFIAVLFCSFFRFFIASIDALCSWDNCPKWSPELLNVHLICHSHDDLGWVHTVDEYYTGRNTEVWGFAVINILNSVLEELRKSPHRRFSYAETGFLTRWMESQPREQIAKFKSLVEESGQLELVGGGWTQPDEATTHVYELINTYQLGLGILNRTFGECGRPRVAWQLDPFGHSREHANLLSLMGYDSLFFTRMHWREREARKQNKTLEFMWNTSSDLNTSILTFVDHRGTYVPQSGFCWDSFCIDAQIEDASNHRGYNVNERVKEFYEIIQKQANTTKSRHLFMYMGGDFQYTVARKWFSNIDRLIKAFNERFDEYGVRMFYSTPSCFVKAFRESTMVEEVPVRGGDFFPHAHENDPPSHESHYWTGYFTSKPVLKAIVRESNKILQWAHQMQALLPRLFELEPFKGFQLPLLERALALVTHHDGVSGTSKEHVTQDYIRRLLDSMDIVYQITISFLNLNALHYMLKNSK